MPTMHPGPGWLPVCVVSAVVFVASCASKPVTYHLPQTAALPIGAAAVKDNRESYAGLFCGVLSHLPGWWSSCDRYLNLLPSLPVETMVDGDDEFLAGYRVLLIGGIFARCMDVTVFEDASTHLLDGHRFRTEHLDVYGNGSSGQNADLIRDYILRGPADPPFIVVGHSKGAVDLLEALVRHPSIRPRVKALLTVASPVAGSRLVDAVPEGLKELSERLPNIGTCDLGDGLGYKSLERSTRQEFFYEHMRTINSLRTYSISAAAARTNTSRILHALWDYQARFSIDQDTHVIADEAVLPGATFLAQANGDHWAVANPMELSMNEFLRERSDRNHYPRAALLEAALRFIVDDLKTHP